MLSNFDLSIIYTRPDGSYVINKGLYHVPDEGDYKDLYTQVAQYAKEHPDIVEPEPEGGVAVIHRSPEVPGLQQLLGRGYYEKEIVYSIEGGARLWDVETAQFVEEAPEGKQILPLRTVDGDDSELYLAETLKFYGFPLGQFDKSPKGANLEERLALLEAELAELRAKTANFQEEKDSPEVSYAV